MVAGEIAQREGPGERGVKQDRRAELSGAVGKHHADFTLRRDGIDRRNDDIRNAVAIDVAGYDDASLIGGYWRRDGCAESARPVAGKHSQLRLAGGVSRGEQDVQLVVPVEVSLGQQRTNASRGKVVDLGLNELCLGDG